MDFWHCGNREFRIFLRKITENIILPIRVTKLMMMPKHIFWPIIDCSSLYATVVTRIEGVVLRRIGECGHFRSRDKDDGHNIRSAIPNLPPPAVQKLQGSVFYRTGFIAD